MSKLLSIGIVVAMLVLSSLSYGGNTSCVNVAETDVANTSIATINNGILTVFLGMEEKNGLAYFKIRQFDINHPKEKTFEQIADLFKDRDRVYVVIHIKKWKYKHTILVEKLNRMSNTTNKYILAVVDSEGDPILFE